MEPPVDQPVKFPGMRANVMQALKDLSDADLQERVWIRGEVPGPNFYNDLDLAVHVLYDDMCVLPDPRTTVGTLIYPNEVAPLQTLSDHLTPLIDALGDVADEVYVRDSRWQQVMSAAADALQVFEVAGTGLAGEGRREE